jgi:hypothetical protein
MPSVSHDANLHFQTGGDCVCDLRLRAGLPTESEACCSYGTVALLRVPLKIH